VGPAASFWADWGVGESPCLKRLLEVTVTSEPTDFDSSLVLVGSIPASNEVIDAALKLVVKLAEETVQGAHGVSVSLNRHGKLRTVAASNDTVLEMDHHQYDSGEGPCVAAAAEGHEFHIDSLARETRWPTFVPKATEQGIKSILSTPLIPHTRPLGALNIYSDAERAFGTSEKELAQLFATQTEILLGVAGAEVSDEQRTARIADALRSREVIALATGVLMERDGATQDEAAARLRKASRAQGVTMRQHASDVVASTRGHGGDHVDKANG
jgi:signal transduction protein with GAF and PtsI domain